MMRPHPIPRPQVDNAALAAEAQWHLHDWAGLKDNLTNRAQVEDSAASLLTRAYVCLAEGDFIQGDTRVQQVRADRRLLLSPVVIYEPQRAARSARSVAAASMPPCCALAPP